MANTEEKWKELEAVAESIGVSMDNVIDAATGLPLKRFERTPTCPACKAKFAHDQGRMCCRKCGLPDEVVAAGPRAVKRWRRCLTAAAPVTRGGSFQRRRRAHGRPRGGSKARS